MPKINRYEDISQIDKEQRKDYVDRHSPFLHCADSAKAGEVFEVKVQVGNEYEHPDDLDHYISNVALYNKETKLAEATFYAGTLGGQGKKGKQTATFNVVLEKNAVLVAQSYCTKHGIWESIPVEVKVS